MRKSWNAISRRFDCKAQAFAHARRGNVAITFALASLPLMGIIGAAIDYSHSNSVKVALQSALDSAALMLARDATTLSAAAMNTKATAYVTGLLNRPEASNVRITATYTNSGGSAVIVNGQVDVTTTFMAALNINKVTVNGASTAKWGSSRLRVALALDNTGSMADDGKMTALKSSTKSLLAQLKAAATNNGDVYVSIIPFAQDVNVGSSSYNATWIDWDDWEAANGYWQYTTSCSGTSRRGRSNCSGTYTWVYNAHSTWNGCVTDRDQNYDQLVTQPVASDANLPSATASTLFPADQYAQCPVPMMGLNYNWTSMNALVDSMTPNGGTNQPIGLVWAWQSLVGGGPLTAPAKDANYQYQEIIILMSDGLNTINRWYGNGSQQSSQVDGRMYNSSDGSGTCANIKASGVIVYTVQVNTGGDPLSTLLQKCASDTTKFWQVKNSNDLGAVFNTIGTNITKLRVAN